MVFSIFSVILIFISIVALVIASGSENCNIEYDEFHGNHPAMNQRVKAITTMLNSYQLQHGMKTLEAESDQDICKRIFVINNFWEVKCDNPQNNQVSLVTLRQ